MSSKVKIDLTARLEKRTVYS